MALDPNFATNHYYYVFYTAGTPNRDRLSRFTANATLTGTVPGSELILYQDPAERQCRAPRRRHQFRQRRQDLPHDRRAFQARRAQDLTSPRGKILRFNPDGTVPTDNPFYDGTGPNYDAIWALGLRNPYRAYYDAPTGRLLIGDVGGNDYSTAIEEVNVGARGANYGWPNVEGPSGNPAYTNPIYSYPHNGRDAAITGGFVYHGTQFPSSYQGSYFFADYAQNWIRRLTFDANGNVNGVFNFEPADGPVDGPYGDIVYLTEGPEGALYYVDLGYSDNSGTFGVSKIRRISYSSPICLPWLRHPRTRHRPGAAHGQLLQRRLLRPRGRAADLFVEFRRRGNFDCGQPGPYLCRRWQVSGAPDGFGRRQPHALDAVDHQRRQSAGRRPSHPDRGTAVPGGRRHLLQRQRDGHGGRHAARQRVHLEHRLPARRARTPRHAHYRRDERHVHDSDHRARLQRLHQIPNHLTVTDSSGLQSSKSVIIFPHKVNLTFDTAPAGLTLYLDGIAHTARSSTTR